LTTLLQGGGGIGKSTVAAEIAYQIKESWEGKAKPLFKDGILWIKVEKEHTLENILEEIIKPQLGIEIKYKNFETNIKKILDKKDILVVLDSAEQNETLIKELLAIFNKFPILITSRKYIDGIPAIELDNFNREKTIKLFVKHLGGSLKDKELEKIANFCKEKLGGLPLAITIIANYMRKYRRSLDEVLKHNDILNMEYNERTIFSVIRLSYDELSPLAKKVFAISSIYKFPFQEKHLLEIVKKDDNTIETIFEVMNELVDSSLVEKSKVEDDLYLYNLHPLVREFANKQFGTFKNSNAILEASKEYIVSLADDVNILDIIYKELFAILEDDMPNNDKKGNYKRFIEAVAMIDWWLHN
jgi:hypothetical protein